MGKKFAVLFAFLALAVASAKTYTVTLYQPATLGGSELKPGEYKLEIDGQKAVMRNGKIDAEAPVKVETADKKFANTTVRLADSGGKMRIEEIRLGGTNTRLVFSE